MRVEVKRSTARGESSTTTEGTEVRLRLGAGREFVLTEPEPGTLRVRRAGDAAHYLDLEPVPCAPGG